MIFPTVVDIHLVIQEKPSDSGRRHLERHVQTWLLAVLYASRTRWATILHAVNPT